MQMTKLMILLLTVSVTFVTDSNASNSGKLSKADRRLMASITENLGGQMLKEVSRAKPDKNVVVSGFSLLTPLQQLSLATEGASHEELLRAIGSKNDVMTRQLVTKFDKQLSSVGDVELNLASKIYVSSSEELNSTFENDIKAVFNSDISQVDFINNEAAANDINRWVEDKTNKKIKNLVSAGDFNGATDSVLVDALYFKGKWFYPFDETETKDRDFHVNSTASIKIPTMHKIGDFSYGESKILDAKFLQLPYKGNKTSMLIILPNQNDGLKRLRDARPTEVSDAIRDMRNTEVDVNLPKFKIETETNLKDILKKIGVTRIFSPRTAQMTRFINGRSDMFISGAKQKATIEVSEIGTEAAAAVEFIVAGASADSAGSVHRIMEFHANRPFYFAVCTGPVLLFSGIFRS